MRYKMKLIDANTFEDEIRNGWQYDIPDVIKTLRDFPTAYDIDKVVEELETTFDRWGLDDDKKSTMREIVKKGGVECFPDIE